MKLIGLLIVFCIGQISTQEDNVIEKEECEKLLSPETYSFAFRVPDHKSVRLTTAEKNLRKFLCDFLVMTEGEEPTENDYWESTETTKVHFRFLGLLRFSTGYIHTFQCASSLDVRFVCVKKDDDSVTAFQLKKEEDADQYIVESCSMTEHMPTENEIMWLSKAVKNNVNIGIENGEFEYENGEGVIEDNEEGLPTEQKKVSKQRE